MVWNKWWISWCVQQEETIAKGTIIVPNMAWKVYPVIIEKKVMLKICAAFTDGISEINNKRNRRC